ncbi:MAG: anaerobic sulfatase maturase [Desulfobacterales bacterium]|nr:MAG: anaerobic sulfatase maturase [Desulfobacterales bacterium]
MHFQVMAKPSGAACNLNCTYCFYTEKDNLYDGFGPFRMPREVLESFIHQYIECQDTPEAQFAWQGGEPALLGIDYFRSVVSLQEKYAGGKKVSNTIQTNGTLLTDDWCRFFKKRDFLVGLSIDGPRKLHDRYRVKGNGGPSFDKVMSGLALLRKHKVSFNTLTVVNDHNSFRPLEVYRFLKRIGDGHMQFIPAVERLPDDAAENLGLNLAIPPFNGDTAASSQLTPWSVSPEQLANFYIRIFDEWVRHDVGTVFVQFFDVALGNWLGAGSGLCQFSPTCGMAGALEHNGDLYSCDHYVYPKHKLGNIMETPLSELMASETQQRFGNSKLDSLPAYCKACEVRPACHGDCPKHRFAETPDGVPGLSYLCEAYKAIFNHMTPYLRVMAELIQAGRPAPDVMRILREHGMKKTSLSPGRNAPCPCGSGKKFKRCCGA